MVLINGEPGIGKSRIIDTVLDQVGSETGCRILLARSSMYRQYSAFYPLIEMLQRQVFHFEVSMTPDEKLSSVADSLNSVGLDSSTYLPLFGGVAVHRFRTIPTSGDEPVCQESQDH